MTPKLTNCAACNAEIASTAKVCPQCGAKVETAKKPIFKKWWFWAIIVVILIVSVSGNGEDASSNEPTKIGTVGQLNSTTTPKPNTDTPIPTKPIETTAPIKTVYNVGDILMDGKMKIVFVSSGEHIEENQYNQPDEGYMYIFLKFAFENTSDKSDDTISAFSFKCYADGYAMDAYYGDEMLSATLSAGRATTGYVYFTVPVNAQEIEVEYTTNYFTSDKITFMYEGNKDSGYEPPANTTPTPGAFKVGDIVESSKLVIAYLSCEEYISDNMFVQPKEGYRFVTCTFEFTNKGSSDEHVSYYDFDCYADGFNCNVVYIRDDSLSATISSGRKAKGTVTFEIPIDATVIEVEFLSNYWTSNRVVFTVEIP